MQQPARWFEFGLKFRRTGGLYLYINSTLLYYYVIYYDVRTPAVCEL